MNRSFASDANILIASDITSDAKLIKNLLDAEFDNVFVSPDPDKAVADFDHHLPDVLVLAFKGLEKSERHCLKLHRHGSAAFSHPHRTIVLCSQEEIQRAYKLCRENIFDDYVLFWPMTNDAPRLHMALTLALREMRMCVTNSPTTAEFATEARRLSTLENLLNQQLTCGEEHIESIRRAIAQAALVASAAFDTFSQRLARNELSSALEIKNADGLQKEIGHLKHEAIEVPGNALMDSVKPLKQWAGELREATAPYLQFINALNTMATSIQPMLLVVDDDQFQNNILNEILKKANYQVQFATNGTEALNVLRKMRPDLILMDVVMPGVNGIEVVRQIKSMERFADIPVLMLTGKSERTIIMESLKAGACDIIVKPFVRDALLAKLKHTLKQI